MNIINFFSLLILYYIFIKKYLIKFSSFFAHKLKLTHYYPLKIAEQLVQLPLLAISHGLFAYCLMQIYQMKFDVFKFTGVDIFCGVILGISCMTIASLMGFTIIQCFNNKNKSLVPENMHAWLAIGRGGWLRKHYTLISHVNWFIALPIVFLQIASEEIIFRGVFFNALENISFGAKYFLGTLAFTLMQATFMNNRCAVLFPLTGGFVMGIIHNYLYLKTHFLTPLIISHFAFFLFAIL